jgi:hypothetical protein
MSSVVLSHGPQHDEDCDKAGNGSDYAPNANQPYWFGQEFAQAIEQDFELHSPRFYQPAHENAPPDEGGNR